MREKDPTKRKIMIDKTIQMVGQNGLHNFSIPTLAEKAKVSPATVYIHFENKDDMLFEAFKEAHKLRLSRFFEGVEDEQLSLSDALYKLTQNLYIFSMENTELCLFIEQMKCNQIIRSKLTEIEQINEELYKPIRKLAKRHQISVTFFTWEVLQKIITNCYYDVLQSEKQGSEMNKTMSGKIKKLSKEISHFVETKKQSPN